ncbi:TPA: T9SS type A sorting domain-containing protein [Candidatus Poribacteria bacterium]|nr:T9SS type A sorting domain-containing protein [Candidatus Poribacteria bacterium]
MSEHHETMHLQINTSGGAANLLWDDYEGFDTTFLYRILRDTTGMGDTNFVEINSVTNTNFTYTDLSPPANANYLVEVVHPWGGCTADKGKNFNSSKSNTSSFGAAANPLSASTSSTDVTFGMCDGTATVTATGGTPPLTYLWDGNANNQTTTTATNLCPGTYSVVVTDSLGNEVIVFASVGTLPGIGEGSEQNGIALYPNPNTGDFRVEWNKSTNIERLLIYNTLGQIVYYVDEELTLGAHNINLDGAAPGLYYLQIETGGKPLYQKVIIE